MKRQGISSVQHAPNLSMSVQYLKGVGPKRAQAFARLGVRTVADTFYLLPLRHEDRRVLRPIRDLSAGLQETVVGEVKGTAVTSTRRGFKILSVILEDGTGTLVAKWFHQPYLQQRFHPGHRVIVSGKVSWGPGFEMVNPDYEAWEDGSQTHTGCIVPVYPLADGLFQRWLRSFMKDLILARAPHVQDFLPHGILHRHALMALPEALRAIHFPEQMEDAEAGKRRLAFDDLLLLSLGVARMRRAAEGDVAGAIVGTPGIETAARARLGFELTAGQERVLKEIRADMARPRPMMRLLPGGVGAGKTAGAFLAKGARPHTLVMTATPIPRTLALALYGDLNVSVIEGLPPGRHPVKTELVPEGMRLQAYQLVREEVRRGGAAYVICPLVEEREQADLKAATSLAAELQKGILRDSSVGCIHGRMRTEEKRRVMDGFRNGEIQVLVATTVVEVGMYVPRATVVVVEHADRLGLTQLHQIRGRVGRAQAQAFCLLIHGRSLTEEGAARLQAMAECADGFQLAERDLELRGPGELFGTRQAGVLDLKVAHLLRDVRLLEVAQREAFRLVEI